MDRSFPSSFTTKSPFSPRSRQSVSSKRILPSSFRKSSRLSLSGKSAQSVQIILKSARNYLERFGQSLPVLITEALTFADRNTVVSARISECGYAWVVCGRRLLIWQYRYIIAAPGTPQRRHGGINQCYELQLPQSDLAHRAELVSVFTTNGSSTPSCIAVSPEGVLRYWPAIAHEVVTVEQQVDFQGQECDSLTDVAGLGCILATTTCTVVLVQPQINGGRHSLLCKQLKTPSGWLGGISRKMSSLIFGPISSEQSSETRLVRVLSHPTSQHSRTVYVLAGHSLQKWQLTDESEHLVSMSDLTRIVRDKFRSSVWENNVAWDGSVPDHTDIDTWLLDIQSDKDAVIVLAAAVNMHVAAHVYYALISFTTDESIQLRDFLLLKIPGLYRENNPGECLSYRFLLCGTHAYVYNDRSINVIKPHEELDTLELNSSQDFLLGGSICVNTPIFFSRINGLVAVSSNEQIGDLSVHTPGTPVETSFNESMAVNNLSMYHIDPEEIYTAHKDTIGQLKAAFIFHIKNQQIAYQEILEQLFPPDTTSIRNIDSALDNVVLELGKGLLDDVPAGDPRWNKDVPPGLGSSYSMQVLHQLEDKQTAFSLYVKFLKDSGIWQRLSAVTLRDTLVATAHFIGELSEKITASIIMKSLPNSLILENAIEKAVRDSETELWNNLTNKDLFYRQVSDIHKGLQEIVNCCEDSAHSDLNPTQVCQIVHDTNEIILTVLNEVVQYRNQNNDNFAPAEAVKSLKFEYLPWTAANGSEGVADALLVQHTLTYNYGLKITSQGQLRNSLLDHFVAITDFILDGRKSHLESIHNSPREHVLYKQYCSDRHKLIQPLLKLKEWEKAALLAEKYLDFESLLIICDVTDNQTRLDEYMERFCNERFSEYVYNWFLKQNKQGKLIDKYRKSGKSRNHHKLSDFLQDHPSLSWMQQIFDHKFSVAAETLYNLAVNESESVTRQKTMFSLSKLAKLAGQENADTELYCENIDSRLDLVTLQEELPDYVLQIFGYDTVRPRIIPPNDLINLYICSEYSDAGELEYKKALDILVFVDDTEVREELNLKIWRSAILRDSWNFKNLDSPLEILQGTLFFRLVDMSVVLGANPLNLLPPIEKLTEDESMQSLQENKSFQYLIKAAYEHIFRMQLAE